MPIFVDYESLQQVILQDRVECRRQYNRHSSKIRNNSNTTARGNPKVLINKLGIKIIKDINRYNWGIVFSGFFRMVLHIQWLESLNNLGHH